MGKAPFETIIETRIIGGDGSKHQNKKSPKPKSKRHRQMLKKRSKPKKK